MKKLRKKVIEGYYLSHTQCSNRKNKMIYNTWRDDFGWDEEDGDSQAELFFPRVNKITYDMKGGNRRIVKLRITIEDLGIVPRKDDRTRKACRHKNVVSTGEFTSKCTKCGVRFAPEI